MMKRISNHLKAFVLIPFLFACVANRDISLRNRLYDYTEVEVPMDAKLAFTVREKDNFFPVPGRRAQYGVFSFEKEPTTFLHIYHFIATPSPDFENSFDRDLESYDKLFDEEIPSEYLPNWEESYHWRDFGLVYFIYFVESKLLCVVIQPT